MKAFKPYFTIMVWLQYLFSKSNTDAMMLNEPHFSQTQLASIQVPTLLIAGEYDIVKLKDTAYMHETIPHSQIVIIKCGNHSSCISQDGAQAYVLAKNFLSKLEG